MPRLTKGGKWVYGYVVVGDDRYMRLPYDTCSDYGFREGDAVVFLTGGAATGGFELGTPECVAGLMASRMLGRSIVEAGRRIRVPEDVDLTQGQPLLAVRKNTRTLAMIEKGPLYEAAAAYPRLPLYLPEDGL